MLEKLPNTPEAKAIKEAIFNPEDSNRVSAKNSYKNSLYWMLPSCIPPLLESKKESHLYGLLLGICYIQALLLEELFKEMLDKNWFLTISELEAWFSLNNPESGVRKFSEQYGAFMLHIRFNIELDEERQKAMERMFGSANREKETFAYKCKDDEENCFSGKRGVFDIRPYFIMDSLSEAEAKAMQLPDTRETYGYTLGTDDAAGLDDVEWAEVTNEHGGHEIDPTCGNVVHPRFNKTLFNKVLEENFNLGFKVSIYKAWMEYKELIEYDYLGFQHISGNSNLKSFEDAGVLLKALSIIALGSESQFGHRDEYISSLSLMVALREAMDACCPDNQTWESMHAHLKEMGIGESLGLRPGEFSLGDYGKGGLNSWLTWMEDFNSFLDVKESHLAESEGEEKDNEHTDEIESREEDKKDNVGKTTREKVNPREHLGVYDYKEGRRPALNGSSEFTWPAIDARIEDRLHGTANGPSEREKR
ncbi:MAG: hypothetical protein AAGM67_04020, partial [Bacteroidota bacterium]